MLTTFISLAEAANQLLSLKDALTTPPEQRLLEELVKELRSQNTLLHNQMVSRAELNERLAHIGQRTNLPIPVTLRTSLFGPSIPQEAAEPALRDAIKQETGNDNLPIQPVYSSYGTAGYALSGNDGCALAIFHASGEDSRQCFVVRKGIGWFYRECLGGVTSFLGFPTTNEFATAGRPGARSSFEGGHIEWVPQAQEVRVFRLSTRGEKLVATKKL